jgi:membrane-bound lytic murein transglycosylase
LRPIRRERDQIAALATFEVDDPNALAAFEPEPDASSGGDDVGRVHGTSVLPNVLEVHMTREPRLAAARLSLYLSIEP